VLFNSNPQRESNDRFAAPALNDRRYDTEPGGIALRVVAF
jgi:hypothetical protein